MNEQLTPAGARRIRDVMRADPVIYCEKILGVKPWSLQQDILRSVVRNKVTRVKSCHSAGKSFIGGCAVSWFLPTQPDGIVITTAPTARQVRGILWKEIRGRVAGAKIKIGPVPKTQSWNLGPEWFAIGFTAPEHDSDRFQGWHSKSGRILVVADEAAGISQSIWDGGISSIISGEHSRLLMLGNPTDPSGEFAKSFHDPEPGRFTIDAFQTPNFTAFGITLDDIRNGTWESKITGPLPYPGLVDPYWVAQRWRRWGESSDYFRSRVLAQFPQSASDTAIPMQLIERARLRAADKSPKSQATLRRLGVDVARFGADESVIALRSDRLVSIVETHHGLDTMSLAAVVVSAIERTGATETNVDVIGVGAGVVDRLNQLRIAGISGVNVAEKASDDERFGNLKAELWWNLRDALERDECDLEISDDEAAELSAPKYKIQAGRTFIEDKAETKKRIGKSPDSADAIVLAWSRSSSQVVWF